MISRLHGILLEKHAPNLLIDVNGVGYEVLAPMTSIYPLPKLGGKVVLHTHLNISETAHQLFGFYTLEERKLFRLLIKVNGVGPKMALAILSGLQVHEFVDCVANHDFHVLVKIPGVGKKTAERLVIEIKDKLNDWTPEASSYTNTLNNTTTSTSSNINNDAESALIALGYKASEASKTIQKVQKTHQSANSEELIRLALRSLAG